jgi:hypothetical protein
MDAVELTADPDRVANTMDTGIYVRAKSVAGVWASFDIAELDAPSLLAWLRSRGGENPWAENCVATLLGHDNPIA